MRLHICHVSRKTDHLYSVTLFSQGAECSANSQSRHTRENRSGTRRMAGREGDVVRTTAAADVTAPSAADLVATEVTRGCCDLWTWSLLRRRRGSRRYFFLIVALFCSNSLTPPMRSPLDETQTWISGVTARTPYPRNTFSAAPRSPETILLLLESLR